MSLSIPLRNGQCPQPRAKTHKSLTSKTSHLLADLNRFYNRPSYAGRSTYVATPTFKPASSLSSDILPVATSHIVGSNGSIDSSCMPMPERINAELMDTQPTNIDGPPNTMHPPRSGPQDTSHSSTIHPSPPLHTPPPLPHSPTDPSSISSPPHLLILIF